MALFGSAALAMWWDISADIRAEFEHWHSHEHFPERLGIPGFHRASRWRSADGGEGVFVMYELASFDILSSAPYLARLNAPSPWSTRMMPHHRHMVRSQCRVLASAGANLAGHVLTIRLSPAPGRDEALCTAIQALGLALKERPGCVGAHLLQHQTPAIAQTTEQKIRGGDRTADWVWVVMGYDLAALQALAASTLSPDALVSMGAAAGAELACYNLSHTDQETFA